MMSSFKAHQKSAESRMIHKIELLEEDLDTLRGELDGRNPLRRACIMLFWSTNLGRTKGNEYAEVRTPPASKHLLKDFEIKRETERCLSDLAQLGKVGIDYVSDGNRGKLKISFEPIVPMANRFEGSLQENNELLTKLNPANETLRLVMALELQRIISEHSWDQVLDFGCGEGFSTTPLLRHSQARHIAVVDVSDAMISEARKNLAEFGKRVSFYQYDAREFFLSRSAKYGSNCAYGVILSSWAIHNFHENERRELFKHIFNGVRDSFILMDKVYPNRGKKALLALQLKRYDYLPQHVRDAIVAHENEDFSPEYRMDEATTLAELRSVGFREVEIIDRVERDVVIVAKK